MGAPPGRGGCSAGATPQSGKQGCRGRLQLDAARSPLLDAWRRQSEDGQQHNGLAEYTTHAAGDAGADAHLLEGQADSPVQQWVSIPPQANVAAEVPDHSNRSSGQENAAEAQPNGTTSSAAVGVHEAEHRADKHGKHTAPATAEALSAAVAAAAAAYDDTGAPAAQQSHSGAHPMPRQPRHATPQATPHAAMLRSPWARSAACARSCDPGAWQPGVSDDGQLYTQSHNGGAMRSPVGTPSKQQVMRKLF